MELTYDLEPTSGVIFGRADIILKKQPVSLTFGNFDGVHLGHQYLLKQLKAQSKDLPLVVLSFDPHPAAFFNPDKTFPFLTLKEDKVRLLQKAGADVVILVSFNKDFANLSADDFCSKWLGQHFNIHNLMMGYDLSYGKNRVGCYEHMKSCAQILHWNVQRAEPYYVEKDKIVSSSEIRAKLLAGQAEDAEKLLGRPYFLSGVVVEGDKIGRKLGYPTANLCFDLRVVPPQKGIYICYVEIESDGILREAVMSVGVRPTIGADLKLQIEAYILNFSDDIYGCKVKFHLKKFLREELKFDSMEQLVSQIGADVEDAKRYFRSLKEGD